MRRRRACKSHRRCQARRRNDWRAHCKPFRETAADSPLRQRRSACKTFACKAPPLVIAKMSAVRATSGSSLARHFPRPPCPPRRQVRNRARKRRRGLRASESTSLAELEWCDEAFRSGVDHRLDLRGVMIDPLPDRIKVCAERGSNDACDAGGHAAASVCSNTIEAFVPPKPNEFEMRQCTRASRASFLTISSCQAGSGSV